MSDKTPAISVGEGLAILANVGVVIGLLFVWFELRQNQTQLHADVELSLASAYQQALGRTTENQHVAEVMLTAYRDPESLDEIQYVQLLSIHAEWMAVVYATYELRESGAIDEETWTFHSAQYLSFLQTQWMQNFWRGMHHEGMYPPGFLEKLESRMPTPRASY